MSNETQFVDGLIVKAPRDNAPGFVKASISIRREGLIAWLQSREGEWINLDVKESKGGKWYAAVNDFKAGEKGGKPKPQSASDGRSPNPVDFDESDLDDLPF